MSLALILAGFLVAVVGGAFLTAWLLPRAMPEPEPVDLPTDDDPELGPTQGYDMVPEDRGMLPGSVELGQVLDGPIGHRVRRPAAPGSPGSASWPPVPPARQPHPSERPGRHAVDSATTKVPPYTGRGR